MMTSILIVRKSEKMRRNITIQMGARRSAVRFVEPLGRKISKVMLLPIAVNI